MNISQFINEKAERAGIRNMDELAKRCKIGQATIYRYLREERTVSPTSEKALCDVLELSGAEMKELRELIENSIPQKPMKKAFQTLDAFVIDAAGQPREMSMEADVVLLDKDRLLMSKSELFERMLQHSDKPDFRCCLRIIGGVGEEYFHWVVEFIEKVFKRVPSASVEHLIHLCPKEYAPSTQSFFNMLPLFKYEKYSLFYSESEAPDSAKTILGRSFYFSTSYDSGNGQRRNENFLLSVRDHGKTECICSDDLLMHEFLTNDYFSIRRQYKRSLAEFRHMNQRVEFCMDKEQNHRLFTIKSDLCYPRIPLEVYISIIKRIKGAEKEAFLSGISEIPVTFGMTESITDTFITAIESRFKSSFKNPPTDVCSKAGLLEFVKTGRLADHYNWLPAFSKEEMRITLEYVRDRNEDENDEYNLYIIDKPVLENGYVIFGYQNKGALFQHRSRLHTNDNIYIQSTVLAELISEYAKSYIPNNRAVSKKETTAYLNSLIDAYLK